MCPTRFLYFSDLALVDEKVIEEGAYEECERLGDKGCPNRIDPDYAAEQISPCRSQRLDNDECGEILSRNFFFRGLIDVNEGIDRDGTDKESCDTSCCEDAEFRRRYAEEVLPQPIAYAAEGDEKFDREKFPHLTPEGREEKVSERHRRKCRAEHIPRKRKIVDQGRRDRMCKIRRNILDQRNGKESIDMPLF